MDDVSEEPRPGLVEVVGIAVLLAFAAAATLVTYARLEPSDTYHVSAEGVEGGLGRTLVLLNFPIALVAIGAVPLAVDRLTAAGVRWAAPAGVLAVALCAWVPFVVDQDDLDARAANLVPAAGVAICAALVAAAWRRGGIGARRPARGDGVRIALAVVLALLAVPWLFAELGFYAPDPVLADEPTPGERVAAVHLGHHHGTDGVLLALAALALSREVGRFHSRRLAAVTAGLLSLMLVYGLTNAVQDAWLEQLVKRGTTDVEIPSVLLPAVSPAWGALLAGALLVFALWFGRDAGYASPRSQSRHSDMGT